jgi:hypothetical protein
LVTLFFSTCLEPADALFALFVAFCTPNGSGFLGLVAPLAKVVSLAFLRELFNLAPFFVFVASSANFQTVLMLFVGEGYVTGIRGWQDCSIGCE